MRGFLAQRANVRGSTPDSASFTDADDDAHEYGRRDCNTIMAEAGPVWPVSENDPWSRLSTPQLRYFIKWAKVPLEHKPDHVFLQNGTMQVFANDVLRRSRRVFGPAGGWRTSIMETKRKRISVDGGGLTRVVSMVRVKVATALRDTTAVHTTEYVVRGPTSTIRALHDAERVATDTAVAKALAKHLQQKLTVTEPPIGLHFYRMLECNRHNPQRS